MDEKRSRGRPPKAGPKKDRRGPYKQIRVNPELFARLEAVAARNDRDIAREARRGLMKHVEEEEARLGIASPQDPES